MAQTIERQPDGTWVVAAPEPSGPLNLERSYAGGVTSEIGPAIGGGAAALVGAQLVNGLLSGGVGGGLLGGGGPLVKVLGKGAAAWAALKFSKGATWGHYAAAFLIFDAALDLFPLDKMIQGTFGGILGAPQHAQTVAAAQEGGHMDIDELYRYLKNQA